MGDDRITKLGHDIDQIKDSLDLVGSKIDKIEDKVHESNLDFKEHVTHEAVSSEMITSELRKMNKLWEKNDKNWQDHMYRTRLNEVAINHLKEINEKAEKRLQMVENDLNGRRAIVKFFKIVGIVGVAISGIIGAYAAINSLLQL